jgi:hypothetical protein
VRVTLEAAVGVQFDDLSEGKITVEEFVCAGSVYRVISFLSDRL